jgi:Na+/melibiose symporter-like transporter
MAGLAPENGTTALFVLLFVETIINGALAIATGILLASMIADVVEDSEVKTGRRSEGLLMSADNLFKKMVSGVGVFVSGLMLTWISFPQNAKRGAVDQSILNDMAWTYLPAAVVLYGVGIVGLLFLRVSRERHEQNLATLRERAAAVSDSEVEAEAPVADAGGVSATRPPNPPIPRPSQA